MPQAITPRLQLVGEIARGGMGAILKGRDVDLGRDLAVKVLLETHQGKTELTQRFVEEAQINGQLQHPGIVPVYELGVFPDQRPYFTMKLVKGQTLASLLAARQDVTEDRPRFVGIFAQVCQTLAYAHARGVIHRDLKPSNVMVGAFGEVQVMDWGLAKVLKEGGVADEAKARLEQVSVIRTMRSPDGGTPEMGPHTQAGTLLGTPAFAAPEQARGEVDLVDERADVFGLGAILCAILTGQPPFTGKGAEALRKAQTAQLEDVRARLDGCGADAELIALAQRCLAAEPWQRPRHAGQVAEEMTAYQHAVSERLRQAELARAAEEARAVEAQATAAQERQARQAAQARALAESRSRRLTLALAASVLLSLVAGGGGWLWWRNEREAQRAQVQHDVNAALNEATTLRERAKTAPARQAAALAARAREQVQRAGALVKSGPADAALTEQVRGLLAELEEEEKDRQLLIALDAARLAQAETNAETNRFAGERAVPPFREAFRTYGLAAGEVDAEAVAARLRERPLAVREAVLAAVDEWIFLAEIPELKVEEPHREWLRAVRAATEPDGWSKEVRDAAAQKEPARRRAALEKLAVAADVERLPARALTMLASRLRAVGAGASAMALLRRAQVPHAGDFWINHDLGVVLRNQESTDPAEAVRFLTAAVALRPDSAGAQVDLGVALQDQGKLDEAIAQYQKALAIDTKYAPTHNNLGNVLQAQGQLDEAIDEYQKALAIDPNLAPTHNNLGGALKDQGKLDEAIDEYQKALAIDPKLAPAHVGLGNALKAQGQVAEAIKEYQKAIDLDPKLAQAHNGLGSALEAQGKVDEAIKEYQKAIALDPKFALAHYDLGVALKAQGKVDEAIAEYKKAIDLNPKLAQAHNNLGVALQAQGKLDEAIKEYQKAIDLNPKHALAHNNLGSTLQDQGKVDEAIAQYQKALAIDPKNATAHNNLGLARQAQGKADEAIAEFRKAIDLDPKYAQAHRNLGNALNAQDKADEAINEYKKAIDLDPKDAHAHNNLGVVLKSQGQVAEAIAQYHKAIGLDPKYAAAHKNLGNAFQVQGKVDEAIAEFKKVIDLDPKDAQAHNNLGNVLQLQRKVDDAIKEYQKAIALDPKYARAHYNLGNALYAQRKLAEAIAQYQKALAIEPKYAQAHNNLGLARQAQGKADEAIAEFRKAIALDPKNAQAHGALGQALLRQGRFSEARASTRRCLDLLPARHPLRPFVSQQLRQCQRGLELEPKLPRILAGEIQLGNAAERLEYAELCQLKKLHVGAAQLYAKVFAADPKMAGALKTPYRYNAACCAALAGSGQGKDADKLDAKERARWRRQALDWLRADLSAYGKLLEGGKPEAGTLVQQRLQQWRQDRDLTGIRDKDAVDKLPAQQREACQRLWADVEAFLQKAQPQKK
jgi:serine/threonine-protein kinase